jgi:prepilin-type N-terminal cleavage/methylation domain-containing protein
MPTDRAVVVALPPRTGPPALSGRHPSGDSGFSLIEVLVAIFVIGTVMAGVAPFLVRSLVVSVHQRSEQVAIQVANDALERVRALDPSSLLTGRGKIEVERQWAAAPAAVADYLADSTTYVRVGSVEHKAWDPELALGSTFGAKAPLPTAPYAVDVNDMRFEQHWYVGLCWQAKATAGTPIGDCERSVAEVPFFRVVVAVTWHQRSCPAENCVYVASTLVSRGTDPVFDL